MAGDVMVHGRFARSRLAQWAAWLVSLFCVGVIVTGMIVGQTRTVQAEDAGQADAGVVEANDQATGVGSSGEKVAEGEEEATFSRPKVGEGQSGSFGSRALSFLGIFFFIGLAWLMSNNRRKVNWRLVGVGIALQLLFAVIIFYVPYGDVVFDGATQAVKKLLDFTNEGSSFIFESYVTGQWEPSLINFTFAVLPTIIFFSSLMTILYHLGIMQAIVKVFAIVMQKAMGTSGAESLSAAANIFVGQTEAPLVVKPYVDDMTLSELMTVMTGGFATVAGGVLAIYVGMLEPMFPDIAGHLLAASVMSAPAALVVGKIMIPEVDTPVTAGTLDSAEFEKEDVNVLDAASRGAAEGLKLALNVGAMLLAFIALIGLVNYLLGLPQVWTDNPATLQDICSYLFWPVAFAMGVPVEDCFNIGRLLGIKMVVNELVAYAELQKMLNDGVGLQDRSIIIATYALCGFANFGSIGIQLGGIGGIAPNRKHDLAKIAFRAMIAGTIAAFMTATIAGILV
jgi:CNT family concentrative nucleoside transporter